MEENEEKVEWFFPRCRRLREGSDSLQITIDKIVVDKLKLKEGDIVCCSVVKADYVRGNEYEREERN